jgi:hypothetical protein
MYRLALYNSAVGLQCTLKRKKKTIKEVHFDYLFCDATELVPVILVNIWSWRYLGKEDKMLAFCSASLLEVHRLFHIYIYIYISLSTESSKENKEKKSGIFLTLHIEFYYFDI